MWAIGGHKSKTAATRPVLDLSGPRLRRAFENLVESADDTGGVERYVGALALKASLFEEVLGKGRVGDLTETEFYDLAAFITPVRRRIATWLGRNGFAAMHGLLQALLRGWSDLGTADQRIGAFVASFPDNREHRWCRDLAAEVLHFTVPEHYPLMTRWMWDARANTGVSREIWHSSDRDAGTIAVGDSFGTFAMLREDLDGFLQTNGVFRDLPFYVDLLCAHIYAGYINDKGGQYLHADFCGGGTKADGMAHTRRLLGLDAVDSETGRTRLKLIDGEAYVLGEPRRLSS